MLFSRHDMAYQHSFYLAAIHSDFNGPVIRIKRDTLLSINELLFPAVLVIFRRLGISGLSMAEFPYHAAKSLIGADFGITSKMHAHLRAVVAAEHRAVIHKRHLQTIAGSGCSGTHSGNSPSHDNKIIFL